MNKKITVFISGSGTATAISVIKGLRLQKEYIVNIISCDASSNVAGKFLSDSFYKVPPADDPKYLEVLLDYIKKSKANLFIPIIDYEFLKIAGNKKSFLDIGCTPVISDESTINVCIDKFETVKFFHSLRLLTPLSYSVNQITIIKNHHFPLFIKPSYLGRSTINAYKIEDQCDLDYFIKKVPKPIIQEFIEGTEITIDGLCDLQGNFIAAVIRRRDETKSGLSVKGETITDPDLLIHIKKIVETIRIIGPFNIQCIKNKNNEYVFIEINPRFAGGHPLTIFAGLNTALLLCKNYFKDEIKIKDIIIKNHAQMIRYWNEFFIASDGTITMPYGSLINEK